MSNEKNKKGKYKSLGKLYFLEGFILCLILLTPASTLKRACLLVVEDSASIRQYLIMLALRNHIDSIGEVPDNLADIRFPESEDVDICKDIFYYPDAWGKPGQILLLSEYLISRSYVVTFGDGSRAFLTRWNYKFRQENNNIEPVSIRSLSAALPLPNKIELIWFCLLIVIFVCLIVWHSRSSGLANQDRSRER